MERSRIPSPALLLGVTLSLAGCGGSDGLLAGPPPAGSPGEVSQARLDRVAGCRDLLEFLRQDGQVKVRDQANGLRQNGWRDDGDVYVGAPEPTAPGAESDRSPENFSDTNVQVEGVDEADFVETDGEHIYLLDWDRLVVVDSWPPSGTAIEAVLGLEGHARSMFVDRGRAVIFSEVFDEEGRMEPPENPAGRVIKITKTRPTPEKGAEDQDDRPVHDYTNLPVSLGRLGPAGSARALERL